MRRITYNHICKILYYNNVFFGKVATHPPEEPISGYYISNTGKQIDFTISPDVGSRYYNISFINIDNDTLSLLKKTFKYNEPESLTMSIFGVNEAGGINEGGWVQVSITKAAYDNIIREMTNTVTQKKPLMIISLMSIPDTGKWMPTTKSGGSSIKPKRTHRKPTKRRRNHRGNRKTKKN